MTPTMKHNAKNYLIQTLISIVLLGAGALFSTVVWPAIQQNTKDIKVIKTLHQTDYSELSMGQQAIRSDIKALSHDRVLMDSLIFDKLDKIDQKIGF